jgi:hypothetical protein
MGECGAVSGNTGKVDCAINVFGKPNQTALALLSLFRHSGAHIDTVYFVTEPNSAGSFDVLLERLPKVVRFTPRHWLWTNPVDEQRLGDEDYRLSIRYQYAWERSDKRYLFVTHNDCAYTEDIVGAMLGAIGDRIAIGRIGQCWNCPAEWTNRCDSTRYLDYRPSFDELAALYRETEAPAGRRLRRYDRPEFATSFRRQPWPLPECRVNEWAAMIDLERARPLTRPIGSALPFGAYSRSGSDTLDIGVAWFRGVSNQGCRAAHMHVEDYVRHGAGHPAMFDRSVYDEGERRALEVLRMEYDWRDA